MASDSTFDLITNIRTSPPGTLKLYRATEDQPEVEQAMANRSNLAQRINHARQCSCFIEVISLRIQYMDMWLRVFFENTPHTEVRKKEFGALLKQCFNSGFEKNLYDRIHNFNQHRINAIHGYLVGTTNYGEISKTVDESDGLSEALAEYVLLNSGEIVTEEFIKQHHNRGDMVFHIPNLLQDLRSRLPI